MDKKTATGQSISIIYAESNSVKLGDNIRIKKIIDICQKSSFNLVPIIYPTLEASYLSTSAGLKNVLINVFPLHKCSHTYISPSHGGALKKFTFNIKLNYLLRTLKQLKPTMVIAETSTVGWMTLIAAKQLSIPFVIDVHGLAFAEAKGMGNKNWRQIMQNEKLAFESCDKLIVVSKRMKNFLLSQFKISNKKIIIAPNGGNIRQSKSNYQKPLNVIYSGAFSYWEKVDDFLEIAKYADSHNFKFYLAGSGLLKNDLLTRIRKEQIPITYLGYIPKPKIYDVLSKMQIGIAPSTKDLARQVASPIKVFDYMASGLPVITPKFGDWGEIIENENCGIALKDDSIKNYIVALNLFKSESFWKTKSINALKSIKEKYNWDKTLSPITTLLSRL